MAKAVADPEELRRFAQSLKKFNGGMNQSLQKLQAQAAALAQTWRDQEHAKFQTEFDTTMRQLARFVETSDDTFCR